MERTTIINTETEVSAGADILSKSDRVLKVALDGTEIPLTLHKSSPHAAVYVGHLHSMEFTSTGE